MGGIRPALRLSTFRFTIFRFGGIGKRGARSCPPSDGILAAVNRRGFSPTPDDCAPGSDPYLVRCSRSLYDSENFTVWGCDPISDRNPGLPAGVFLYLEIGRITYANTVHGLTKALMSAPHE
jgi:hypothetical protein